MYASTPAPEPQPAPSHSKVFAAQFQPSRPRTTKAAPVAAQTTVINRGTLPSAFALFKPSWEAVQRNLASFVWIVLVPSLFAGVGSVLTKHGHHSFVGQILSLVGGIYSIVVLAAVPLLSLLAARGQKVQPEVAIKSSWHFFWRLLGLYIVIGIIVLVGLLLFIVPGIIMLRRYFLAPYFLVDGDLDIGESIRQSGATTKGYSGAVWGVIGVEILLSLVGIIPIAGTVIVMFAELSYACAPALRYLQLKELAGKTIA